MRAVIIAFALLGLGVLVFVDDPKTAGNILILFASVCSTLFSVFYAIRSNWRATEAGKSLVYVSTSFAALGWFLAISLWWSNDFPFREPIRLVLYWALALSMLHRLLVWFEIQRHPYENDVPQDVRRRE